MEDVLNEIQKLHNLLKNKISGVDSREKEIAIKEASLNAFANNVKDLQASLSAREAEVKKVENIFKEQERAKDLLNKVASEREAFEAEKRSFQASISEIKKQAQADKHEADDILIKAKQRAEFLDKKAADLERDKANFKKDVLKGMGIKV